MMECVNLYDSMMNRQVNVHLNYVFLKRSFSLRIDQKATIENCLNALKRLEPEFMKFHQSPALVFDDYGRRLSLDTCLLKFGEVYWINLFVT